MWERASIGMRVRWWVAVSVLAFAHIGGLPARATDYTSTNFILRDPVVIIGGGYASSASFQHFSSIDATDIGETTSSTFTQRAGFLYFSTATTPVVTATAGNQQVTLTWTAVVGTLGNVTDYRVGTATTSGGPYTYESVGNVLSFVKGDRTNGTTYYFRIQAQAAGEVVALSVEVSATPAAPALPSPGGGGGGGGGGTVYSPTVSATGITLTGRAYPRSTVTILKDAQVVATTVAGADANFRVSITGLTGGNYIFAAYGEDKDGGRSSLLTFPVSVTTGATTTVSGIFLAPTIAVDKSTVKRGDDIAIFGQSSPQSDIVISVNSPDEYFAKTIANKDGVYLHYFDTTPLELGSHLTKSKSSIANQEVSGYSYAVNFRVGDTNVSIGPGKCGKADLNCDGRVNLVDFSIAAFWYKRRISPAFVQTEKTQLNGDGKVDLVDFSVMAFHWTG